jgi:ubiquinone/menaquinone biosynthesis C-methylase UbiE
MTSMDWNAQGGSGPETYQEFLVPGMFTPFAERLIADVGVAEGDRVIDIACGTGVVARIAAVAAGEDGAVTGVDLGQPMLDVARARPGRADAAPIKYVQGSADALPVEDASFDVATCHHGLQFFPDRLAALRDARRVLRPGGRIGIGCWSANDSAAGLIAISEALQRHVSEEAGAMMRSPFSVSVEELATLLEDAGFENIETSTPRITTTFTSHAEFAPRAIAAGPIAAQFAAVDESVRAAVTAEVRDALEPYATADGGVAFPMVSNVAIAAA